MCAYFFSTHPSRASERRRAQKSSLSKALKAREIKFFQERAIPLLQHNSSNDEYAWSFQKRERRKKKRGDLLERASLRGALIARCARSFFCPFASFHLNLLLLGEKALEDKRLVLLFIFTLWSYSSPRTGAQKSKRNKDASHDAMVSFFIFVVCFLCVCACAFCKRACATEERISLSSKRTKVFRVSHKGYTP